VVANAEDPADAYINYKYLTPDSRAAGTTVLNTPWEPGNYEVRHLHGSGQRVNLLGSSPFTVTDATLEAPATAATSSQIEVRWAGPLRSGAFIDIAPADLPSDADGGSYAYVTPDSRATGTVELTAPSEPGEYRVRFIVSSGRILIGSSPITIQ